MKVEELQWVKIGPRFHHIEKVEYGLVYASEDGITEEEFAERVMFENMSADGRRWYCEYKKLKMEFEKLKNEKDLD